MSDEVRREQLIEAEREEVWSALTDPEGLAAWLAEEAILELEPGGEARFRLPGGEQRAGFVEEVAEPERLSFWWRPERDPDEPLTRVELTLTEVDEGTLLRVTETREMTWAEGLLLPTLDAPADSPESGPSARGPLALVA